MISNKEALELCEELGTGTALESAVDKIEDETLRDLWKIANCAIDAVNRYLERQKGGTDSARRNK